MCAFIGVDWLIARGGLGRVIVFVCLGAIAMAALRWAVVQLSAIVLCPVGFSWGGAVGIYDVILFAKEDMGLGWDSFILAVLGLLWWW